MLAIIDQRIERCEEKLPNAVQISDTEKVRPKINFVIVIARRIPRGAKPYSD
jgi:hypothetical protein